MRRAQRVPQGGTTGIDAGSCPLGGTTQLGALGAVQPGASAIAQKVKAIDAVNVCVHAIRERFTSSQLLFLGLLPGFAANSSVELTINCDVTATGQQCYRNAHERRKQGETTRLSVEGESA